MGDLILMANYTARDEPLQSYIKCANWTMKKI